MIHTNTVDIFISFVFKIFILCLKLVRTAPAYFLAGAVMECPQMMTNKAGAASILQFEHNKIVVFNMIHIIAFAHHCPSLAYLTQNKSASSPM